MVLFCFGLVTCLVNNKRFIQYILEEKVHANPQMLPPQPSNCPKSGVCGYSVFSFQTHEKRSIWGNSGGEHFHADSETSRMTPVWRCHAWLWKGKNNASLEKGKKVQGSHNFDVKFKSSLHILWIQSCQKGKTILNWKKPFISLKNIPSVPINNSFQNHTS